jgi:hypothetical protein
MKTSIIIAYTRAEVETILQDDYNKRMDKNHSLKLVDQTDLPNGVELKLVMWNKDEVPFPIISSVPPSM